jgi:hypothetical protein
MQIKVNFLCRDSILAAPVALDLALFLDLAQRAGLSGIQEWLSFYFKSPMSREDLKPGDLFIQHSAREAPTLLARSEPTCRRLTMGGWPAEREPADPEALGERVSRPAAR